MIKISSLRLNFKTILALKRLFLIYNALEEMGNPEMHLVLIHKKEQKCTVRDLNSRKIVCDNNCYLLLYFYSVKITKRRLSEFNFIITIYYLCDLKEVT